MSAPERTPAGAGEPRATIYDQKWEDARDRLEWVLDEDVRALLASAMDQVESGWDAVGALQRWAEQYRDPERPNDDYGALLTFAESEVQDVYRLLASNLAEWVREWPGDDLPPANDVDNRLSEFGRYATVLTLATGAALDVPNEFWHVVHQVGRLRPRGAWFQRLADTFMGVQIAADGGITAYTAPQAVDFALRTLPESERERARGRLVAVVAAVSEVAGPLSPKWLAQLVTFYWVTRGNPPPRMTSPATNRLRGTDGPCP